MLALSLVYCQAVLKKDCVELLAIDDHVVLQKLPLADVKHCPKLRDSRIFDKASKVYKQVGLNLNDDKKRRNLTRGVILGAELDGLEGTISPRGRILCLAVLSAVVADKGSASREPLERLLGCWVHALMFRRPVFSAVDQLFKEGHGLPRAQVFCLSHQARNELLTLSGLFPCLTTHLRASYDPNQYALDASGAVCASATCSSASAELWRFGEYHTRFSFAFRERD